MKMETLGTVAKYINGRAFKPSEWEPSGKPIIRIQNLTSESAPFNYSTGTFEDKYIVRNGDLLFAWSASLGAHIWKGEDAWLNQHIFRVVPNNGMSRDYLYYYLRTVVADLYAKTHGSGMVHITKTPFMNTAIPVPPLEEQKHIVSKIEELFSELDSGVETLKTTKQQLAVYRQAVLKAAFEGCKRWRKFLFSDLMQEVRNGYGIKPDDYGPFRILKISSIRPLHLDLSESRLNNTALPEEDTISENDILFTRYNGSREYVGICAVVPKLSEPYAYPDKLIKCRPKLNNTVHSKYLAYFMSQGDARKHLRSKIKTTSGQNGIAGADIKGTVVFLPDLETQAGIVAEIDSRLSVCASFEKAVDAALQQAEAMRQSILKKAFKGGF
jgi:type I restriction enzyme S subunit